MFFLLPQLFPNAPHLPDHPTLCSFSLRKKNTHPEVKQIKNKTKILNKSKKCVKDNGVHSVLAGLMPSSAAKSQLETNDFPFVSGCQLKIVS